MWKLILGTTLLIVQASYAVPTPSDDNIDVTDLKQLILSAGTTYEEFFGYATDKYQDLFERVLTKSNDDAESDPELKTALMPFAHFVNKMRTMKEKPRGALQELFEECTHIADKYDRGVPVDASEAEQKVAKYMNDENAMKTKFDILMKYVHSLQWFANNVRKFLNSMPEGERNENHKKLMMWYINWQREHEWEKKNDLMVNFFEIFDDSKDDRSRLIEKVIRNILLYLNEVVMARKNLYKKTLPTIENELKDGDAEAKRTIALMKEFIERAEKVHDLKGREITIELLTLFNMEHERRRWYTRTDKLSDGEKKIAKILEKNGEVNVEVREAIMTFGLGEQLTQDVEEYFDIIPRDRMEREGKLKTWFENVMGERDYDTRAARLVALIEMLRMD